MAVNAFVNLPKATFGGIAFPYSEIEIVGGVRDHVHEYPHVDGGDPELLGRKLYTIRIKANFQRTFRAYKDLYPTKLGDLLEALEASKIDRLVVPQMGIIEKAYAVGWTRRITNKILSGEMVDLEFREQSITGRTSKDIEQRVAGLSDVPLVDAAAANPGLLAVLFGGIQAVQNAINAVTAYADQVEMYGNLLEGKLVQLQVALGELDRIDKMQEAESYPALTALRNLQTTTNGMLADLLGRGDTLDTFIVPQLMPIQAISSAIYGNSTRSMDLLHLNPIENAMAVPAGFPIRFFRSA